MSRENLLTTTLVELADTLVTEFDALDFMHTLTQRSVELLEADAAGVILVDPRGRLQVMASTHHQAQVLEVFQIQNDEGPCQECCRTGQPLVNLDLDEVAERWPRFRAAAREAGFQSTHAVPMRLRDQVIGALNLFCAERSELSPDDLSLAQAMADIATIGLLQERLVREQELLSEQLQNALNSRVLVEQAKGVLAQRASLGIDEAFELMRSHSRRSRRPLTEVARAVIHDEIDATTMHG
jgi:GAF domain-containing protein